jgi:O-antigen/teichoic acid export membrane protein
MTEESRTTPAASERGSVIMTTVGRQVTSSTGVYIIATGMAIPVGIVSTIITVQYLTTAQFGQLGLLMVLASFLTVLYNVGLLHGTFLWVYGSSGEGGDDLEIDGVARASVAGQRTAMGTGLILTLIVVTCGTLVCFIFAKPLAALLLGSARKANLIGLAAISGGAGSIFRLTVNVFRFERRPTAFATATIARPIGVLVVSTALIVAGYGVWGAVLGTAMPTVACAIGCVLGAHRSYALKLTLEDARQIAVRGATVVIPVIALFVLHNGDIYLLAHWVSTSQLGVYRLASRLGSPPSYFASAFIMTWGPLERSSLVTAAFHVRGQHHVRSLVITYYMLAGLTIVVLLVVFSPLLVLVAPGSYAEAAKLVPLIGLAYVMFGAYIVVLRTTRPERMMLWYAISAICSVVLFIASSSVLIPAFGLYGAPTALIEAMVFGSAIVVWRNARNEDPVPIEFRRILAGFLVAGAVSAVALVGIAAAGNVVAALATVVALLLYVPALVFTGAIPASHLPLLRKMVPFGRTADVIEVTLSELPAAEQDALARFRDGTLHSSESSVDYARFARALRRIGGIGQPCREDARIGIYLASREPEAIRDYQMRALLNEGVDAFELYRLDRLAKAARRPRFATKPRPPRFRAGLRASARSLNAREHAQLAEALAPAATRAAAEEARANRHAPALGLVRAIRILRKSFGVGAPTATDLALARALWHEDDRDLSRWQRTELRVLKRAARLASQAAKREH